MKINILNLNSKFQIENKEPPSSDIEIEKMKKKFLPFNVPEEYISLIRQVTEAEILIMDDVYIRIWGANGCIEMNIAYNIQKYIPNSFAIGDDEGGMVIFYGTGSNGFGLYKVGFGNLDINDAEFISKSLYDFLIDGKGVDIFC